MQMFDPQMQCSHLPASGNKNRAPSNTRFVDNAAIEARVSFASDVTAVSIFLKPDLSLEIRLSASEVSHPLAKLGGDGIGVDLVGIVVVAHVV